MAAASANAHIASSAEDLCNVDTIKGVSLLAE